MSYGAGTMRLTLRLRFHTHFGQELFVTGEHAIFGGGDLARALPLAYLDSEHWETKVQLPQVEPGATEIVYHYVLREPDGTLIHDAERSRSIAPGGMREQNLLVVDAWVSAAFYDTALETKAFRDVILKASVEGARLTRDEAVTHVFRTKAPLLREHETLCLLGEGRRLANWHTEKPVLLARQGGDPWSQASLDLSGEQFPLSYKYGVYDTREKRFVRFEAGDNRVCEAGPADGSVMVLNDVHARLERHWHGVGMAVPVFSLRSGQSGGVGEFADLTLLADWAAETGVQLIQILPVNDTSATGTWKDSYPYAAISAFALHPLYLRLTDLGEGLEAELRSVEPERQRLNALPEVDYEAVMRLKLGFLRHAFQKLGNSTLDSRACQDFIAANQHWLKAYTLFSCLRDRFGSCDFASWPKYNRYDPQIESALVREDPQSANELQFHYFLQFHLDRQLANAAGHLHQRGIALKGDIAIGVNRCGADAWQHPDLFKTEMQAGAPPDAFAVKGQNWGFPTYNWKRMQADGYAWWRHRFSQMSRYFDAFRIDHILGFFRIWSVPREGVEGILGYFDPALPVTSSEFAARGIPFDRERLVEPLINADVLKDIFGHDYEAVKREFFDEDSQAHLTLKPEVDTQAKVEGLFARRPATEENQRLKEHLFDVISNVILLPEIGHPDHYHFRYDIAKTSSFRCLEPDIRKHLEDWYLDYFFHRQESFWAEIGRKRLPALQRATELLICGEDLGMVPVCVPVVMRQLGLLGLEVQRMPKVLGREFSRPAEAPYLSVVTPGTHDMSSVREWWEENPELTRKFYNEELGQPGAAPHECTPDLVAAILRQHLASPAMWSIFQIQDLLGASAELRRKDARAERINVPGNSRQHWCYRLHLNLELLKQNRRFNAFLKELFVSAGRSG